jgi:hypothetical protein
MEREQAIRQLAKRWAKTVWWRLGPSPYKQTVLGWSLEQSDSELSQEINAQNGTCRCGLPKFGCIKLALKLDVLETKPQEGIGWPSAPLSRGPDGPALDLQGTKLNVALHQVTIICQPVR